MSWQGVDEWLDVIDRDPDARKLPIALIATKSDLEADQRKVNKNLGENRKKTISSEARQEGIQGLWGDGDRCFKFAETSSYEDVDGVRTVFNDICKYVIDKSLFKSVNQETETDE